MYKRQAYEEIYELIRPVMRHKTVLELAAGTGLIAKQMCIRDSRIVPRVDPPQGNGGEIDPAVRYMGKHSPPELSLIHISAPGDRDLSSL